MTAVKIFPWTEWKAKTRDWLVGIKVRITFDELARIFQLRFRRKPLKPTPNLKPNPKTHD